MELEPDILYTRLKHLIRTNVERGGRVRDKPGIIGTSGEDTIPR